jgi:predicted nuclease of predicted toxin-antitoxin system
VKLLFDENLSPSLIRFLAREFPDSQHVDLASLRGHPDLEIWGFARQHEFVIVSKDNDFRQMSFLRGPPPKVIWLSVGNAGTAEIGQLIRQSQEIIEHFGRSADESLLVLESQPQP